MSRFKYQAVDAAGQSKTDTIEAAGVQEAAQHLRERGLFVTQITPTVTSEGGRASGISDRFRGPKFSDVVIFTQQMSMLLRSGARVTEALDAILDQKLRPGWGQVVASLRNDVEEGRPLSAALNRYPQFFSPIFVSITTAGEASGELGPAFQRLAELAKQQQDIRHRVIGAMSYPAVLLLLCAAVMLIMMIFVLPRFADMFDALDVPLPWSTSVLIAASQVLRAHWLIAIVAGAAVIAGAVFALRGSTGRRWIAWLAVRVPIVGELVRNIIIARLCRIWGQLLESKIHLLQAVELVSLGITHPDFKELLGKLNTAVTQGNRIGPELRASWLVSKTYAGAIGTGEDSGRLTDSLLFVASSLEDQNRHALDALTRVLEPLILAVMGLVVGILAFSLFLPMFDMANLGAK